MNHKFNERERVHLQNRDLVTKNCAQQSQIDSLRKQVEKLQKQIEEGTQERFIAAKVQYSNKPVTTSFPVAQQRPMTTAAPVKPAFNQEKSPPSRISHKVNNDLDVKIASASKDAYASGSSGADKSGKAPSPDHGQVKKSMESHKGEMKMAI